MASRVQDSTKASYAACRRISRQARSSFYAGFLLLPNEKRRAMESLYAFARVTDDIVDGPGPSADRGRRLAAWRNALTAALDTGQGATPSDRFGTASSADRASLLPALADTVKRFSIPGEYLLAMIDGAAMDLDRNRYETFDELKEYCRRVASSVGLACIHIWGFRGEEAFALAEHCGIAMQLTNILRDIREDLARNRVYLPQSDLRKHHYTEANLRNRTADLRFQRFIAEQIARAEGYYRDGVALLEWLEPDGQRAAGLMLDHYRALLHVIERRPEAVLHRRVTLPFSARVRLALRCLAWRLHVPRAPHHG